MNLIITALAAYCCCCKRVATLQSRRQHRNQTLSCRQCLAEALCQRPQQQELETAELTVTGPQSLHVASHLDLSESGADLGVAGVDGRQLWRNGWNGSDKTLNPKPWGSELSFELNTLPLC